jgi:hypothetical protein
MDGERDPLDALQRAFREWPPPGPTRSLADEDAATRRTVAWLAEALRAQEPARTAPLRRAAPRARQTLLRDARPLAAAALLLLLLGVPFLLLPERAPAPATPPTPVTRAPPAPPPGPATAPGLVVAASRERIELRSGPVQLLLLTPAHRIPREVPR